MMAVSTEVSSKLHPKATKPSQNINISLQNDFEVTVCDADDIC